MFRALSTQFFLGLLLSLVAGCGDEIDPTKCGNGIINTGEDCDDGNLIEGDGCDSNCTVSVCGNGIVGGEEECDDGNRVPGDGCDFDCRNEFCGDDRIQGGIGEECDDGNQDDTDACPTTCLSAVCGDGFTRLVVEACDDGNTQSEDGCNSTCTALESCGDGIVQGNLNEFCDDGNNIESDACVNCLPAQCGDGFLQAGVEECDPLLVSLPCNPNDCQFFCGDGVVDTVLGEECEDGNNSDGDGCNNDCTQTKVTQIDSGQDHSCAALNSGDVVCWGSGGSGRLGYGDTDTIGDDEDPSEAGLVNIGGKVMQVAVGVEHSCALLTNGRVRCWGRGLFGRLGYGNQDNIGDNEDPATAGDVVLSSLAIQITAGDDFSCALLDTGEVQCWGAGDFGRLGYGNEEDIGDNEDPSAAGTLSLSGSALQISAGGSHACAILVGGGVQCWGNGLFGRLGYSAELNIGNNEAPSDAGLVNIGGPAIQVSAGGEHSCALRATGEVVCWGTNFNSVLGYGNNIDIGDDEFPVVAGVVSVGAEVIQLTTGDTQTCVLLASEEVKCWGFGLFGSLGYGNQFRLGDNEVPSSYGTVDVGEPVTQISAGSIHTCALLASGEVRCWGDGQLGKLGYEDITTIGDNEVPSSVGTTQFTDSIGPFKIAAGPGNTCVILNSFQLRCWGIGAAGVLGFGNTLNIGDNETPLSAPTIDVGGGLVFDVSLASNHICALVGDSVKCWGSGDAGRLGYGNEDNIGDNETPASVGFVDLSGESIAQVVVGDEHSCALFLSGLVKCWGRNDRGQLGQGNTQDIGDNELPSSIGAINLGARNATQLAAAGSHTCALFGSTGEVFCWGSAGNFGVLGYGNAEDIGDNEEPFVAGPVSLNGFATQITTNAFHTCALLQGGFVQCWGNGSFGQLGYGNRNTIGDDEFPSSVQPLSVNAEQIVAGFAHTCSKNFSGEIVCWGSATNGSLGYANQTDVLSPDSVGFVDLGRSATQITAGSAQNCAILDNNTIRCWGENDFGQLGIGSLETIGDDESPDTVVKLF
jgi:cysteine-rich repeat protein